MSGLQRVGDLDIDQDLAFQRREWAVQRVGWIVMLVVVLLALAGLFSTGPLSSATADAGDGAITAGYQRFVRHDGRSTLTFEVAGDQASNNEIELWVSRDYLNKIGVQQILPEPAETRGTGDRVVYVFAVDDPSTTLQVSFSLRPQDIGRYTGEAGVLDGPTVTFTQIAYP